MHCIRLSPHPLPSYSNSETELEDEEMSLWGDSGWETEDESEDQGPREVEEGGGDRKEMEGVRQEGRVTWRDQTVEKFEAEVEEDDLKSKDDDGEEYWTPNQETEGKERHSNPKRHQSEPEPPEPFFNIPGSFLTDSEEHSDTDSDAIPGSAHSPVDLDIDFFAQNLVKRRVNGMKKVAFVLGAVDEGGEEKDACRKDSKEGQVAMSSTGNNRVVRSEQSAKQSATHPEVRTGTIAIPASKPSPIPERHFPLRGGIETVPTLEPSDGEAGPTDLYFRVGISDFDDSSVESENEDNELPQEWKHDKSGSFSTLLSGVKESSVGVQNSSSKSGLPMRPSEVEKTGGNFVRPFSNLTPLEHMILDMAPYLGISARELAAEMFDEDEGDEGRRYSWPADCWVKNQLPGKTSPLVVQSKVKDMGRNPGRRADVKPVLRRKRERQKSEDLREAFSAQERGRNDTHRILQQSRNENRIDGSPDSSGVVGQGKESSRQKSHDNDESQRQGRSTPPTMRQQCIEKVKLREIYVETDDDNERVPLSRRRRPRTQEYGHNRRYGKVFDSKDQIETRQASNNLSHTGERITKENASINTLPSYGSLGRNIPTPEPIPIPIRLTAHDRDFSRAKQRINTISDVSQREIGSRASTGIVLSQGSPRSKAPILEEARFPINRTIRSSIIRSSSPVLDNEHLPSIIKITDPAIPSNLLSIIDITDPPLRTQTPYPYQRAKRPQDSYTEGLRLQSSRHHAWTIRQRAMALERAVSRQSRPDSRGAMRYATIRVANRNSNWKGKTEAMRGYWRSQVLLLNKLEAGRERVPLRLSCPRIPSSSNSSVIPVSSPDLPRTETPKLRRGFRTLLRLIRSFKSPLSGKCFKGKEARRVLLKRPQGLATERSKSRNWFSDENLQLERVLFRGHQEIESRPRSLLRVTYGE